MIFSRSLRGRVEMNPTFATDDRHPRERLDSRFRGNEEKERQLVEIFGFILGQALRNGLMMRDRCSRTRALRPRHLRGHALVSASEPLVGLWRSQICRFGMAVSGS